MQTPDAVAAADEPPLRMPAVVIVGDGPRALEPDAVNQVPKNVNINPDS